MRDRVEFSADFCKCLETAPIKTRRAEAPTDHFFRTTMEAAINILISQFKTFAGKHGSSSTLSRDEFHALVTQQLPNHVKVSGGAADVDQLMASLDANNDGELTFLEFWQLIGALASQHGGFDQ